MSPRNSSNGERAIFRARGDEIWAHHGVDDFAESTDVRESGKWPLEVCVGHRGRRHRAPTAPAARPVAWPPRSTHADPAPVRTGQTKPVEAGSSR